jgi:sugar (pentulose or hexulose) kinase
VLPQSELEFSWVGVSRLYESSLLVNCFIGDPRYQARHTLGHDVRAILEEVAEESRRQVRTLSSDAVPTRVVAGGGAARSEMWLRIKSETLGCPVVAVDCMETASRGPALLAPSRISEMR